MLEAEFKKRHIEKWKKLGIYARVYCIESEETEPGFPDVIAQNGAFDFFEFKVSDARGVIKFQKTQPSFYKRNPNLRVTVVALDNRDGEVIMFPASALFEADSQFNINSKLEVQLP
jgi:hypothetical protein